MVRGKPVCIERTSCECSRLCAEDFSMRTQEDPKDPRGSFLPDRGSTPTTVAFTSTAVEGAFENWSLIISPKVRRTVQAVKVANEPRKYGLGPCYILYYNFTMRMSVDHSGMIDSIANNVMVTVWQMSHWNIWTIHASRSRATRLVFRPYRIELNHGDVTVQSWENLKKRRRRRHVQSGRLGDPFALFYGS